MDQAPADTRHKTRIGEHHHPPAQDGRPPERFPFDTCGRQRREGFHLRHHRLDTPCVWLQSGGLLLPPYPQVQRAYVHRRGLHLGPGFRPCRRPRQALRGRFSGERHRMHAVRGPDGHGLRLLPHHGCGFRGGGGGHGRTLRCHQRHSTGGICDRKHQSGTYRVPW